LLIFAISDTISSVNFAWGVDMRQMEITAMLMAIILLTGCTAYNSDKFEMAYSVVDPGTPIDLESDFPDN
jgi:hypothetical protein